MGIAQEDWLRERIEARMVKCGSEVVYWRPVVERILPDKRRGFPHLRIFRIWFGTLIKNPNEEDRENLEGELFVASRRHGAKIVGDGGRIERENQGVFDEKSEG